MFHKFECEVMDNIANVGFCMWVVLVKSQYGHFSCFTQHLGMRRVGGDCIEKFKMLGLSLKKLVLNLWALEKALLLYLTKNGRKGT